MNAAANGFDLGISSGLQQHFPVLIAALQLAHLSGLDTRIRRIKRGGFGSGFSVGNHEPKINRDGGLALAGCPHRTDQPTQRVDNVHVERGGKRAACAKQVHLRLGN